MTSRSPIPWLHIVEVGFGRETLRELNYPDKLLAMKKPIQRIRYVRGTDGVQLAWADARIGPVVVKAANWLTQLEYEWE